MNRRYLSLLFLILCFAAYIPGQYSVDQRVIGERVVVICPLVGAGTARDPKRPLFAPRPEERSKDGSGILGYTVVLSDDGQTALVEFVARDRAAFAAILADRRPEVKVFEPGKSRKEDIEAEFRKVKKDFDYGKFKEGK